MFILFSYVCVHIGILCSHENKKALNPFYHKKMNV